MTTSEKLKESFSVWNNLLMEGLDVLAREGSLELVHVEDVFEHIQLSEQELEARLRGCLLEKDAVISHMQAELKRKFADLENLQVRQEKQYLALHDVRVAFENALRDLELSASQVLEQNVAAISHLQEALQRKSEEVEELQECLAEANKEMVLMDQQLTEQEAKFEEQEAKGQSLDKKLEEKDREIQNLQALENGRDLELLSAKAAFEKAVQELEASASRAFEEQEASISQLQEAMKKNTQDMEELQKLLVLAREETTAKETLLSESEVKLGDQAAKVQNLATTLEEKDLELQKLQAVQRRRDLEIRDVRVAFERAVQELETNTSCVLMENETVLSQLQRALNRKSEGMEDRWKLLMDSAQKNPKVHQHEPKLEDHRNEGQNLTTTMEGKDTEQRKQKHKLELRGQWGHEEEMLLAGNHLYKGAMETRKYPETDESWMEKLDSERAEMRFGEEGEVAEEELRKTPAFLNSVSAHDWDQCTTWWQLLEGQETAKPGRRQKEEQAKTLRAKIHLKVKNGHILQYINKSL